MQERPRTLKNIQYDDNEFFLVSNVKIQQVSHQDRLTNKQIKCEKEDTLIIEVDSQSIQNTLQCGKVGFVNKPV